jgi:hypothetical protein
MVGIIKFFGIISFIISGILFFISVTSIYLLATLGPFAASSLLGGALLLAFARVVELLEELNAKIQPMHTIAKALEQKYSPPNTLSDQPDPFTNLPSGSQIERHFERRVAFLPDDSVIGETDKGPLHFSSFQECCRSIGE